MNTLSPDRKPDAGAFNGTRKLIRPHLPDATRRRDPAHVDPLSHGLLEGRPAQESSHAEAFYFQKQIQQKTEITVVLDDGEELTGTLEWYDRCVLKMRSGRRRILVYKAGVKYLYKASDAHPASSVMK